MALSGPTSLGVFAYAPGGGETPHGSGPFSNSITTVNNSLVVAAIYASADVASGTLLANLVVSGGGLTWVRRAHYAIYDNTEGDHESCIQIWTALVTTGETFDITLDCGAVSVYSPDVHVSYYTGHDPDSPIGAICQSLGENPSDGAVSVSLDGAPASTSITFAALAMATGAPSISPGSGWTELSDIAASGSYHNMQTQYRPAGSTSTSVAWADATSDQLLWSIVVAIEVKALTTPVLTQTKYRFFEDGDELPHIDEGTTPVIEAADITTSGSNTATATPAVAYPAYAAGDLLIAIVAADDDDNVTPPANGPNGETRVIIKGPGDAEAGANGPTLAAMYWIGTATQGSGTQNWSIAAAEEWIGRVIKVPAGEFDPDNPIGAISNAGGSNANVSGWDSVAFATPRANSRVVQVMVADDDPWNSTQPSGYTQRDTQDIGQIAIQIATRDAGTTAGETIGSVNFDLSGSNTDSIVGFGFTVQAPRSLDGRTPLAAVNTPIVRDTADPFGLQLRIENSGGALAEDTFKLQARLNGGSWFDVTGSSSILRTVATADYADGDDALEFLEGAGAFVANNNAALETDGTLVLAATLAGASAFELHATLSIQDADVDDEDEIELRLVQEDGTALDTYTVTPTIEVNKAGGGHDLTATGIATGAPSTGTPALGQTHTLAATGVATGAPASGAPVLGQTHELAAAGIETGSPSVGTPTLVHVHALTATGVATGAPSTAAPALGQTHELVAGSIATGAPAPGSPALGQTHILAGNGVDAGAPTVGAPSLAQAHDLAANGIATGAPTVASPALGQIHGLTASGVATAAPTVGAPALGQTHVLDAGGVATGSPAVGAPALTHVHALAAVGIATGAPVTATPAIGQTHALTAAGVATGAPTVGEPFLDSSADNLTAVGIATGVPSVGTPALGQVHTLAAAGVAAGAPTVGSPALAEVHALSAPSIATGAPTVGQPLLELPSDDLIALPIVFGAPVLGVPVLGQIHALAAISAFTGAPLPGAAIFGQTHVLTAADVVAGAPVFGSVHPIPLGRPPRITSSVSSVSGVSTRITVLSRIASGARALAGIKTRIG